MQKGVEIQGRFASVPLTRGCALDPAGSVIGLRSVLTMCPQLIAIYDERAALPMNRRNVPFI